MVNQSSNVQKIDIDRFCSAQISSKLHQDIEILGEKVDVFHSGLRAVL
jgi:hypothetical protein